MPRSGVIISRAKEGLTVVTTDAVAMPVLSEFSHPPARSPGSKRPAKASRPRRGRSAAGNSPW